jgi:hypothetical protein
MHVKHSINNPISINRHCSNSILKETCSLAAPMISFHPNVIMNLASIFHDIWNILKSQSSFCCGWYKVKQSSIDQFLAATLRLTGKIREIIEVPFPRAASRVLIKFLTFQSSTALSSSFWSPIFKKIQKSGAISIV